MSFKKTLKRYIKEPFKFATMWLFFLVLFELFMHQIGFDRNSGVLITFNPILLILSKIPAALEFMNSGPYIPAGTEAGGICVYWYIAAVLSYILYGVIIDACAILVAELASKRRAKAGKKDSGGKS